MKIGRVINNIWATRKDEALVGVKLLIVELLDQPNQYSSGPIIVAADIIGAGIGEKVLITEGSSARQMGGMVNLPVDAVIIGIIDEGKSKVNGVALDG